ncbi:MAG: NfeD family protein [Actinomycetota bacterium]
MRRVALFLCALGMVASWPGSARAQSPSTSVVVLRVEGAIDRPLLSYLRDRLTQAEADGAIVVLQIDTSGTIDEDGVALAQMVADLDVPTIAWVGPAPARASGAGLLLLYASSIAAVAPGSQTGPRSPIDLVHPDQLAPGLDATIAGWLEAKEKPIPTGDDEHPMPGQEAIDSGIATEAATSVPELLNQVDGLTVQTPGGPVKLQTRIATDAQQANERVVDIRFDNMGPVMRTAHGVASPSMIYFLLVIGLACLAFEMTQPGFGFAGFAGAGMVALAAYGIWVVPPFWPGMLLLVGGVVLMMLDVRIRNLGLVTALGLLAFASGSVLAWHGVAETIRVSPWLIAGATVASLLYYGFALTVALQSRDRISNTQRGLIGLVGEARGKLAPEGPVYVKGTMWRGRSTTGAIAPGTPVRIRGVDGLVLRVEPDPGATPTLRDAEPAQAE